MDIKEGYSMNIKNGYRKDKKGEMIYVYQSVFVIDFDFGKWCFFSD